MNRKSLAPVALASVFIATTLVGLNPSSAMACSSSSSSGSGLSHGSAMGSSSVTVCVGSGSSSAGSTSVQTVTKTVKVKIPATPPAPKKSAKPAPKPASNPAPKPVATKEPVSCPSAAAMASMPRSADAAERWVTSLCSPAPQKQSVAPAPKPASKPESKPKYQTITITETFVIQLPGSSSNNSDSAEFFPNPLTASAFPSEVLMVGQPVTFSSNPSSHFVFDSVLGRQAEVNFVHLDSSWEIASDWRKGADTTYSFSIPGIYEVIALARYSVSYRLLGETNWQSVPGGLTVRSNPLEVRVGAQALKADPNTQGALLVGRDCLQNPAGFGCRL